MSTPTSGRSAEFPIAIIGAGFSGICMAIQLKKAGIDSFTILEAAEDVGGTWRDNTYPGCACDVPSHLYSYSFEPNPRWSRVYGEQPEIWDYLRHCVDRYGLRPHLRFKTEVTGATFDEPSATWRIETAAGEAIRARVVVSGTGPLSRPSIPDLPGLARFQGKTFHSARWDHAYDLRGKRVAVVGTGASAIQFVPQIAPEVQRLHLFQRTPPWVLPKLDRPITEREKRMFERIPPVERLYRTMLYWLMEARGVGFVKEPRVLRFLERFAHQHIRAKIADPELRRIVTPDYRMGCKRILISNDYYPALTRPNVEVVTSGIAEIDERAVMSQDGVRREVDAIILGTGFDVAGLLAPMRVHGLEGKELTETWRAGAEAYYGLAVSGFPNLFLLLGPNSGLGHNSIIFMIEAQVHYIMQCLRFMRGEDLRYLDVLPGVQREHNAELQTRMGETIWKTGCHSWYLDEHGRNFTLWPGFTVEYWLRTRRMKPGDFRAVTRSSSS